MKQIKELQRLLAKKTMKMNSNKAVEPGVQKVDSARAHLLPGMGAA